MTTSCEPVAGDVWLTYLYFVDHPEIGKVRPVLIVDVLNDELLALKITSKPARSGTSDYLISDSKKAGLRTESSIRFDSIFVLEKEELLRREPLGHLSAHDMRQIDKRLRDLERNVIQNKNTGSGL